VSPSSVSLSIDTVGTVAPCCTATSVTQLYGGQSDLEALPESRIVSAVVMGAEVGMSQENSPAIWSLEQGGNYLHRLP